MDDQALNDGTIKMGGNVSRLLEKEEREVGWRIQCLQLVRNSFK